MATPSALPVRSIHIAPAPLQELGGSSVWSKRHVPVVLELDGRPVTARLRHRGGHTRLYPKKSYELLLQDGTVLHWNAEYDDPSMLRNALSFHFFSRIGLPSPRTLHCDAYWNGHPIGLYLEIEAVDARFFAQRGIDVKTLIYAVNDRAGFGLREPGTGKRKRSLTEGYEFVLGDPAAAAQLRGFIRKLHDRRGDPLKRHLQDTVDIEAYLKWLAGAVLTGNYDGFEQNYALYTRQSDDRLRVMPWDYEGTWGRDCYGMPCSGELVRLRGYNALTRRLFAFAEYRVQYRRLMEELLETEFTAAALGPVIAERHAAIAHAIARDATRKWSYAVFAEEPRRIRTYIEQRRAFLLRELQRWRRAERQGNRVAG
ncbi:CotH kinase family protein [Paenibacillus sp. IB182496]|uniref:CotH kinase family protein n=1 Tax=Paenibacillus sabuli TaxID=2772509 RepID=A0A927GUR6_9BACL|nr:CotH kinase family protein [Paenibacillus sabuli]MBD2848445.1 CotH kinase family protein [Paenibacillus sabuli]